MKFFFCQIQLVIDIRGIDIRGFKYSRFMYCLLGPIPNAARVLISLVILIRGFDIRGVSFKHINREIRGPAVQCFKKQKKKDPLYEAK